MAATQHVLTVQSWGMLQIGSAEQYAQAGDVILSPEVAGVTDGHCSVTPLEGNNARLVSMSKSAFVSGVLSAACHFVFCLSSAIGVFDPLAYMMWVRVVHLDCSNTTAVLNSGVQ